MKLAFYKGTLAENDHAKFFDRSVCWWTGSRHSHAEVVIADTIYGSVCWSSSFRDGGVRKKLINLNSGRWDIVEVDWDETKSIKWFEENEGMPYDAMALFGFVIPFNTDQKNKVFCTESIARSLDFKKSYKCGPKELWELAHQIQ